MKKAILILAAALLCSPFSVIAAEGPFHGKTKNEHFTEVKKLQGTNEKSSNLPKDWGSCRDSCYNQRNRCYDIGGNSYQCEAMYDACTANCDARY